jgi:hypothetical protein
MKKKLRKVYDTGGPGPFRRKQPSLLDFLPGRPATPGPGPLAGGVPTTDYELLSPEAKAQMRRSIQTSVPSNAAATASGMAGGAGSAVGATASSLVSSGGDWKKVFETAADIKPYLSNVANALSRSPLPSTPESVKPVVLPRVNMDYARNQVRRSARGNNLAANRSLDEQSAAAVRSANLATEIGGLNEVNFREQAADAERTGTAARINAGIDASNVAGANQFRDTLTNRQIAERREQSANFSNAMDKSVAIDNERTKAKLDLQKFEVMKELWKSSGVWDRYRKVLEKNGMEFPEGIDPETGKNQFKAFGGKLRKVFAMGGFGEDPTKPSRTAIDAANVEAKRFASARGLIYASEAHVGDQLPPYIDGNTGKPYVPAPAKPKAMSVPSYVNPSDITTENGQAWYTDPRSGDLVDLDMSVLNHPRFRPSTTQVTTDLMARSVKKYGGKLKKIF